MLRIAVAFGYTGENVVCAYLLDRILARPPLLSPGYFMKKNRSLSVATY